MSEYTGKDALLRLTASIAEFVQSPEAVEAEATYRIQTLQELLYAGEWIQDTSGNIVPSTMPEGDRQIVEQGSRYSIIGGLPVLAGTFGEAAALNLTAIGSLIDDVTIEVECPTSTCNIDPRESILIGTTIVFRGENTN